VKVSAIALTSFVVFSAVVGVSAGWIRALTTPGEVRTWLSPPTALGMFSGNVLEWIGLGDHTDLTVSVVRVVSMLSAVALVLVLVLRPEGRTPVRGAALAFVAVVLLGPVLQPWYLLWALPLAAASGLRPRSLRWVVAGIAAFTLYGMWETSATADSLLELSDWVAMAAAAAAVAFAVTVSPRERALIFGEVVHHGLVPDDAPAQARHDRLVVRHAAGA
jgi:alpha-1,6-mannosyltransferase